MDPAAFRAEFPALERIAYLNAGTDGPIPRQSADAATARLEHELARGRSGGRHSLELGALSEELRGRLAALMNADPDEVALTGSTTDGINIVLAALRLGPKDEVLTSDEEHPGLLAPLAGLHRRVGVEVRVAPFARLSEAVGERTRLIAVSHVSWMSGAIAPLEALRETGVPLLVDGAQGLGALAVDVRGLGCDFYAAAGQKWLCGPDGLGVLFASASRIGELGMPWPSYATLEDARRPLALVPKKGARRLDASVLAGPTAAAALGSIDVLAHAGWPWVFERGAGQAARLRALLSERTEVVPGGRTTLVSWHSERPDDAVERLAADGIVVRSVPGRPWVRASVGAWSSDGDLERLAAAI